MPSKEEHNKHPYELLGRLVFCYGGVLVLAEPADSAPDDGGRAILPRLPRVDSEV
jgi:hypothetical protein